MKKTFRNYKNGFTAVELIIVVSIFSLIVLVMSKFTRDIFFYKSVFFGGLTAYDEARSVLRPMAGEIRSASQSSIGSYPLEITSENTLSFFADVDNDGLKERIRYFLDGSTLKKGTIKPTGNPLVYLTANEKIKEIVHNIRNNGTPVFTYFDTNYNGATSALTQPVVVANVKLVKMTLLVDADSNRSPVPITVTTQVTVRNLKDNL